MAFHLAKRHKNILRFHQVVVKNMINDLEHYEHSKRKCLNQVHNKIKKNQTIRILMEREQLKEIVFLHIE